MSVLFASFAFAQFDFGIKLGANYSYIHSDEFVYHDYEYEFSDLQGITGFVGGAFAIIGFGNFGIQLEGLYSVEGFSIGLFNEGSDDTHNIKILTYNLNAVAMARYNLPTSFVSPFIAVGVNAGIPLGNLIYIGGIVDMDNFDFRKVGLCLAVGAKVLDIVDVELRYMKGLTDIYSLNEEDSEITSSNLIRLSLGIYIF